jgi:hypothetical protein
MKKILLILSMVLLVSSFASAGTLISGKIYEGAINNAYVVDGANVDVTCNSVLKSTTSASDGVYYVTFNESEGCGVGSEVLVNASKNELKGSDSGIIKSIDGPIEMDCNLGVVNVVLIPEFGTVIGIVTAISALGIFFVVRRK